MLEKGTAVMESDPQEAGARAKVYEFLASIFLKEPSQEVFQVLKNYAGMKNDSETLALFEHIAGHDPELANLRQEYYDIFFVPVSGRFIPPFESTIHRALRPTNQKAKFGDFWGDKTMDVAALFEKMQFHPEQLPVFEPLRQLNIPDHVGFELSFMAYLCHLEETRSKKGMGVENIRRLETEFLDQHLNCWLPQFVDDLSQISQSGYYLHFAKLASDFCREERIELPLYMSSEASEIQPEFPTQTLNPATSELELKPRIREEWL